MTDIDFVRGAARELVGLDAISVFEDTVGEDDPDSVAAVARHRGVSPRVVLALHGYLSAPGGGWRYVTRLNLTDDEPCEVVAAFAVRATLLRKGK